MKILIKFFFLLLYPYWRKVPCIFVLSTGRTGTKLLSTLYEGHENINVFHEEPFQMMATRNKARIAIYKRVFYFGSLFLLHRSYYLFKSKTKKVFYFEFSNNLTFYAPAIYKYLPNSKFIFIYRDPKNIVLSGLNRRWYEGNNLDQYRIHPLLEDELLANWDRIHSYKKIVWYWKEYIKFSIQFVENTNRERVFVVDSADIFNGKRIDQLLAFTNCPSTKRNEFLIKLEKKVNVNKKVLRESLTEVEKNYIEKECGSLYFKVKQLDESKKPK